MIYLLKWQTKGEFLVRVDYFIQEMIEMVDEIQRELKVKAHHLDK